MTIKEARMKAGLSMKRASELLEVPYRTWQDWESEKAKGNAPVYVERLIVKELLRLVSE